MLLGGQRAELQALGLLAALQPPFIILYYVILYHIILYYIIVYHIMLYYIMSHCSVLAALSRPGSGPSMVCSDWPLTYCYANNDNNNNNNNNSITAY